MKTPMSILKKNGIDSLDWNHIYSHRNTLTPTQKKIYDKVWSEMQSCFVELEEEMLEEPFKTAAIMNILRTYCPEVYSMSQSNAMSTLSARDRKDQYTKYQKLQNESQVKF